MLRLFKLLIFRGSRQGRLIMRTGFRLGHFSQGHRRICGGPQAQADLKSHELSILDHRRGIEPKELVLVSLREGNIWICVPEGGPRQFLGKVEYVSVGSAQTVIPSVKARQTTNTLRDQVDPHFCFL